MQREVRARVTRIAAEVLVLKKSIAKIEKSMRRLLDSLEMRQDAMLDECEQIDFREFLSKLSLRAMKSLEKAGVVDSASLSRLTAMRLWEIKNCGESTVKEIEQVLAEFGVSLPHGSEE